MFVFGIVGGVSYGCSFLTCTIILVSYFDKKLGLANGITMAGSGLGTFAFAPLTKLMLSKLGWKITMCTYGAIVLQCSVLGAFLRPVAQSKTSQEKT